MSSISLARNRFAVLVQSENLLNKSHLDIPKICMLLTPETTVDLEHRAYYLAQALDSSLTVVASDSCISLFDRKLQPTPIEAQLGKVRGVSLNPNGSLIAISHEDCLTIGKRSEVPEIVCEAPELEETTGYLERGFDDCHFDQQGHLWCVAPISSSQIEVQRREPDRWSVIARTVFEDPFGYSSSSFSFTPDPDVLGLWVAAGQDGQQVYWISTDGDIAIDAEDSLRDTTPPEFAPSGQNLLVNGDYSSLDRYSFPEVEQLGRCIWPFDEDEGDCFAESMAFINDQLALAGSREGRLFVLDVDEMMVLHEFEVAGHELRPCNEVYPALAGETHLVSDISYFRSFGDTLLMVFRRDGGIGLKGWEDSLLLFSLKAISKLLRK